MGVLDTGWRCCKSTYIIQPKYCVGKNFWTKVCASQPRTREEQGAVGTGAAGGTDHSDSWLWGRACVALGTRKCSSGPWPGEVLFPLVIAVTHWPNTSLPFMHGHCAQTPNTLLLPGRRLWGRPQGLCCTPSVCGDTNSNHQALVTCDKGAVLTLSLKYR